MADQVLQITIPDARVAEAWAQIKKVPGRNGDLVPDSATAVVKRAHAEYVARMAFVQYLRAMKVSDPDPAFDGINP